MNNEEFHPISEAVLAGLPYNSELIFRDGKSYRKEYNSDDLEWRELGDGWREGPRKAGARLASEYAEAQIWLGEHRNPHHKFVTGDRLDNILAEADRLVGQSKTLFEQARTTDQLLEARLRDERAQGIYETLRMIRGYHEGDK